MAEQKKFMNVRTAKNVLIEQSAANQQKGIER